ncbi:MAG: chitobiase/beta-hexosaminidase C-terminal domain-containing protein [Nibricoccus sp.]
MSSSNTLRRFGACFLRVLFIFGIVFFASGSVGAATVATPTFSPAAGTYNNNQSVTISTATSGATIRYTTNGSTPSSTSTIYSSPVAMSATTTLKAIALKSGSTTSTTASGTYTLTAATPTFSPAAGTYTSSQTVTIASATSGATIRYTVDGSTPTTTSPVYSSPVAISATTTLKAIAYKSGYNASGTASGVYTINQPAAATPTFSPAAGTYTAAQTVTISSSTSGATIRYTLDGSTPTTASPVYSTALTISTTTTLKAVAYKTGYTNSGTASGTFTINLPKAAAPTFSPSAGTYTSTPTVTISCTTTGASIIYTTDGSTPTHNAATITNGFLYAGPLAIGSTTTLKALAFLGGYTDSSVTTGIYTISLPQLPAPVVAPAGGAYSGPQSVGMVLNSHDIGSYTGVGIAYTLDGSTPTALGGTITNGTKYLAPFEISSGVTVKAVCYAANYAPSSVVSNTYTFGPAAAMPVFTPSPGNYTGPQSVAITSSTAGASIVYTIDGSTPTQANGTLYSSPVSLNATSMLKAIAFVNGSKGSSTISSGLYDIASARSPVVNVVYDFSPSANGGLCPTSALVQAADGKLYGTTQHGGSFAAGTVFRATPDGQFETLAVFNGANGANPQCNLVQANDGNFYGTTYAGGSADYGTVFKMGPAGGITTLFSFNLSRGARPEAGLVEGSDGNFYGTTAYGGPINVNPKGAGTLYKITPQGNLTTMVYFGTSGFPGSVPACVLVQNDSGNFYGTTGQSGTVGSVFVMTPEGAFYSLFSFYGQNKGSYPQAGLAIGNDGNFYGTTLTGGPGGDGTVFKADRYGTVTALVAFDGTNGDSPIAGLLKGKNGNFYGTTSGQSTGNAGTIFKVTPAGALTTLASFSGINGASPWGGLIQAEDGYYYGTTYAGGLYSYGVIYQLRVPTTATPTFNPPSGTVVGAQPVTIATSTSGATIRYSTDGSIPSATSGIVYSGPIVVGDATTVKAIATAPGLDDSPVASGDFNFISPCAAPTFTPEAGTFSSAQAVTISSATAGAIIRYTIDGSIPTETNGEIYTGPITIATTTTVMAVAYQAGYTSSTVTSGVFLINHPPTVRFDPSLNDSTIGSTTPPTLSFDANDSDGGIARVEIYRDGTLVSTLTNPSSGSTWTFTEAALLPCGTYTYFGVVYDVQGASTSSSNIKVTVAPSIPCEIDFESSEGYATGVFSNLLGWSVSTGVGSIGNTAAKGQQALVLAPGSEAARVEKRFLTNGLGSLPLFIDFYTKPIAGTDAASGSSFDFEAGRVAIVRDGASGRLAALDGSGSGTWTDVNSSIPLDANGVATDWQRITVRIDYASKIYDVYLNGQMVAANLKFVQAGVIGVLKLAVTGATLLDDVYVGQSNPLFTDTNNNGISDTWETTYNLPADRDIDTDGDGFTNVQEYIAGTNPNDYYNGCIPAITIVSGDGQSAICGLFNAQPMVISVKNASGVSLVNAPVTFSVTSGGGALSTVSKKSAASTGPHVCRTTADGTVSLFYLQPASAGVSSNIDVFYATASVRFTTVSVLDPIDQDTDGNGMSDAWQKQYFGHLGVDPNADTDGDGVSNLQEFQRGTNPNDSSERTAQGYFVDFGANVAPIGIALDGTITVRIGCTITNGVPTGGTIGRWRNGVVTPLQIPSSPQTYFYHASGEYGGFEFRPELDGARLVQNYTLVRGAPVLNRRGWLVCQAYDYNSLNDVYELFALYWTGDNDTPYTIKGPVVRGHPYSNTTDFDANYSSYYLSSIDNNNGIWGLVCTGYTGIDDSYGEIVETRLNLGDSESAPFPYQNHYFIAGANINGKVFGETLPYRRFFVGVPDNIVSLYPLALNDSDLILGIDDRLQSGFLPVESGCMPLDGDVYGAHVLQMTPGVLVTKPFVKSLSATDKTYLVGIGQNRTVHLTGFDGAGNVYGRMQKSDTEPAQNFIWVAKPSDWGLAAGAPAYSPIPYAKPVLPSGYTSLYGVVPGGRRTEIGLAVKTESNGSTSVHGFALIAAPLVVDANRDGEIVSPMTGGSNLGAPPDVTTPAKPFCFWTNEGMDSGGSGPDCADNSVNGVNDLKDFFPVYLDLKQILSVMPPSNTVKYKLKQADGAVNIVYTNLTRSSAFSYRTGMLMTGFGPMLNQAASIASTLKIDVAGVDIFDSAGGGSSLFKDCILNGGGGIILVELSKATRRPLVLEVEKDGCLIAATPLYIAPFELVTDLNNDGSINSLDSALRDASNRINATDDEIEKGTEYIFVDDYMSNGRSDNEDVLDHANLSDDDDAKEIQVNIDANSGYVWFEHPCLDKLEFFTTKACAPEDLITFPWSLANGPLPKRIFMRTRPLGIDSQTDGDLVLKCGSENQQTVFAESRVKLSVVKGIGDPKFFQACRDYIMENNTPLYVCKKDYNGEEMCIVVMRQEATSMKALDTFYGRTSPIRGIRNVVNAFPDQSVVVNGNFGDIYSLSVIPPIECKGYFGRLISGGVYDSQISIDSTKSTKTLAGPNAYYIAQSGTTFTFAKGEVPLTAGYQEALGGLNHIINEEKASSIIGQSAVGGQKYIFVSVTNMTISPTGAGNGVTGLTNDATTSGATDIFYLDGGSSCALAYKGQDDVLKTRFAGDKHDSGSPSYYIHTYLAFKCAKPRNN